MKNNHRPLLWFALMICPVILLSSAYGDTIKLKNGRILEGKVLTVAGGFVVVETGGGILVNLQESEVIRPDLGQLLQQAEKAFQKGDKPRAREYCRQVKTWDAGNAACKQLLAQIDKADEDARAKIEAIRVNREKRLQEAREALKNGDFNTSTKTANDILKEDPENASAKSLLEEIEKARAGAKEKAQQERERKDNSVREANEAIRNKNLGRALELTMPLVERFSRDEQVQSVVLQVAKLASEQLPTLTSTTLPAQPSTSNIAAIIAQINAPGENAFAGPPAGAVKNLQEALARIAAHLHATPASAISKGIAPLTAEALPTTGTAKNLTLDSSEADGSTSTLSAPKIIENIRANDKKITSFDLTYEISTEIPVPILQQQDKLPTGLTASGRVVYDKDKYLATVDITNHFKEKGNEVQEASNIEESWDGQKATLVNRAKKTVQFSKTFISPGDSGEPLGGGIFVEKDKNETGKGLAKLDGGEWNYIGQEIINGRECALIEGIEKNRL